MIEDELKRIEMLQKETEVRMKDLEKQKADLEYDQMLLANSENSDLGRFSEIFKEKDTITRTEIAEHLMKKEGMQKATAYIESSSTVRRSLMWRFIQREWVTYEGDNKDGIYTKV